MSKEKAAGRATAQACTTGYVGPLSGGGKPVWRVYSDGHAGCDFDLDADAVPPSVRIVQSCECRFTRGLKVAPSNRRDDGPDGTSNEESSPTHDDRHCRDGDGRPDHVYSDDNTCDGIGARWEVRIDDRGYVVGGEEGDHGDLLGPLGAYLRDIDSKIQR